MRTLHEDYKIMNLLKVTEISRIICDTNMGTLKLRIRKGENTYRFLLDAVEVPKDLNKELMELVFPPKPLDLVVNGIPFTRNKAVAVANTDLKKRQLVEMTTGTKMPPTIKSVAPRRPRTKKVNNEHNPTKESSKGNSGKSVE